MAIPNRIPQTPPPSQTQSAPVHPPVSKPADPVRELINIQKINQELLRETAENTELILATIQSERRNKLIGVLLKYVFYGLLVYWSFAMIPKITESVMNQMKDQMSSVVDDSMNNVDPENVKNLLHSVLGEN